MTAAIELFCDTFRCEIAPAPGGSISGLWPDGIPVLRSSPARALTTVRQTGSYRLVKNNADEPGVRMLQPDESMLAEISIHVERLK